MEVLTFHIEDFEGPLDLLLYLVGKNKMNLCDINIMELIDQYTAAIASLQDRMEVSSEFIDMAAHLVQMKSALLLPRSPEAERMKAELTGRLIEYSTCKRVAAELGSRARDLYTAVRSPMPLEGPAEYTRPQDPDRLVVGDDRQDLQRGRGKRRIVAGVQHPLDHLAIIRAGGHLPAAAVKLQQHQAAFPRIILGLQRAQQLFRLRRVDAHGLRQSGRLHRFGVGKQHRLQRTQLLLLIHGSFPLFSRLLRGACGGPSPARRRPGSAPARRGSAPAVPERWPHWCCGSPPG